MGHGGRQVFATVRSASIWQFQQRCWREMEHPLVAAGQRTPRFGASLPDCRPTPPSQFLATFACRRCRHSLGHSPVPCEGLCRTLSEMPPPATRPDRLRSRPSGPPQIHATCALAPASCDTGHQARCQMITVRGLIPCSRTVKSIRNMQKSNMQGYQYGFTSTVTTCLHIRVQERCREPDSTKGARYPAPEAGGLLPWLVPLGLA